MQPLEPEDEHRPIRGWPRWGPRVVAVGGELRVLGGRVRQIGVLAVVTGTVTGLAVALFDKVVRHQAFDRLLSAPLWVQAVMPLVALASAAVLLRYVARDPEPSTADEYIKNFHQAGVTVATEPVAGRILASAATLAGGAALGFEGPSIYIGAVVGSWLEKRFPRAVTVGAAKTLLVCGAAAGVSAIFKAPATGLVFALEVPFREDLARRMLLPAMFASVSSYLVFVAINGTTPLFPVGGTPPFDWRDLGGAALLGLLCGAGARLFAVTLRRAKRVVSEVPARWRVLVAGGAIAGLFVIGRILTGESLVLGSGYNTVAWSLRPGHAVLLVLALFFIRALATTAAIGGGGAGGLFIPLVVQGAVLGSLIGGVIGPADRTLFPLLGVAAFLGAGYRVPLAAIVFVAESTGRPGFVVPGLIAAATSQLLMGHASVSAYQREGRPW